MKYNFLIDRFSKELIRKFPKRDLRVICIDQITKKSSSYSKILLFVHLLKFTYSKSNFGANDDLFRLLVYFADHQCLSIRKEALASINKGLRKLRRAIPLDNLQSLKVIIYIYIYISI